jgi:hypothetical protein
MVDVFISYPRKAQAQADVIRRGLLRQNWDVFFDVSGIDAGVSFPEIIDKAVKNAGAVLGCWSREAFEREWVMRECRVGRLRNVLVPVAIERFDELDVPVEFVGINYLDLSDFDGREDHPGWKRTINAIDRLLGRRHQPKPVSNTLRDHDEIDLRAKWNALSPKDRRTVQEFSDIIGGRARWLSLDVQHLLGQFDQRTPRAAEARHFRWPTDGPGVVNSVSQIHGGVGYVGFGDYLGRLTEFLATFSPFPDAGTAAIWAPALEEASKRSYRMHPNDAPPDAAEVRLWIPKSGEPVTREVECESAGADRIAFCRKPGIVRDEWHEGKRELVVWFPPLVVPGSN